MAIDPTFMARTLFKTMGVPPETLDAIQQIDVSAFVRELHASLTAMQNAAGKLDLILGRLDFIEFALAEKSAGDVTETARAIPLAITREGGSNE